MLNRRAFLFGGVVSLAAVGVACSSTPQGSSSSSTATATVAATQDTAPVTLAFWHAMSGVNGDALNAAVTKFNGSQSRITVNAQFQGNYDDALNKLRTALQAQTTPNVIQVYDIGTRFMADSKAITPTQTFIDAEKYDLSNFEQNVLSYYKVNNQFYSMPFNTSGPILYYNKDAFKAAGLDPEKPPATFEDVATAAKALTKKDSSGGYVQQGIGFYIYGWFLEQSVATQNALYADNGNGRDKPATKAIFNDTPAQTFLQWWGDMVKSGVCANVGRQSSAAQAAFTSGKTAMVIDSTASLRGLLTAVGGKFQIGTGFMPKPANAPSGGGTIIGGASLWIMNQHPQREQQAAWEFIKFMSAPDQQSAWHVATGYYPIRKDAYTVQGSKDFQTQYPQFDTAVQQLHAAPVNRATQGALLGVYTQARAAVEDGIESVLNGQATPKDALDKAAGIVTDNITTYNKAVA